MSEQRTVIRSRFAVILYGVVAVVMVVSLVLSLVANDPWKAFISTLPIPALLLGLGFSAFATPKVVIDPDGVELHNSYNRVVIPRERITAVTAPHMLVVHTDEGSFISSAFTVADRFRVTRDAGVLRRALEEERDAIQDPRVQREPDGSVKVSYLPGTLTGDAVIAMREAGILDPLPGMRPRKGNAAPTTRRPIVNTVNWASVAISALSVTVSIASLIAFVALQAPSV